MKINSITINNFQSYYGEQTIEFGDGLNLIIGNGGKGKSKLFNAFYWVLFGKIYVTSEGWCTTDNLYQSSHKALHNYEYFNKKALSEAKVDGKISCSVQLELEDDKGNNYIIERQASTIRQPQSEWDKPESWSLPVASLKVTYDVPTGTKTVNGIIADGVVSDLFPEGIRGYIWFQGESLDSLINFRNRQNLKEAVRHISYYPFYEKLTAIIGEAKNKIAKQEVRKLTEVNKQNNEAKALLARIRMLRERIQIEEENKKKHQQNIEIIQVALADDESKMEGLAGFSNLISDYDNCEKEIIRLNNRLTELDTEQRRLLPSLWLLRGIDGMIEQSKQIISSHVEEESSLPEKKYIDEPSRIKLEEILNKDHHRLKMQEEYYKELEDYRNNMEFSKQFNMFVGKIQDYPDYLLRSLKGIDKQFQDIADDEEKLMALRKKQHDKKNELEKKIEDVKRKYGVDPHKEASNVPRLTTSIKASRSNLEKEKKLLNSCISTIKEYNLNLEEAERNLGSSSGTSAITKVAETEWKNISIFLESICRDVQEKARKELISKIQIRANEFYDKFTEHDRGYKGRIEINDDYTISFDAGLNTSHEDRKKMSIINALLSLNQEAIGTYYPFISDAPTSSFDPSTTHKYLMGIKDIFHQTIIMTKDVEIGSDKYNDLIKQDKVSRVFQLDTQSYRSDSKKPEIWEVSTIVKSLK